MSALPRPEPMSLAEFLSWENRQDRKHALVDGRPVLMAGASKRHNLICANILAALHGQLQGKPCRPFGSDLKLISPTGNARYPDLQVDCARISGPEHVSAEPRVVIEVISPSNDWLDIRKLKDDYQAHPAVRHILFVSSLKAAAELLTRSETGWTETTLEGLEGGFTLDAVGAELTMAAVFADVDFTDPEPAA